MFGRKNNSNDNENARRSAKRIEESHLKIKDYVDAIGEHEASLKECKERIKKLEDELVQKKREYDKASGSLKNILAREYKDISLELWCCQRIACYNSLIVAARETIALKRVDSVKDADALLWSESLTREAGTRQTLSIGNAEYGFCWIPSGEFDMGSPESEIGRSVKETLHHVKLTKGFWMLETAVTQALYKEIMVENPSEFEGDDFPVESVSWDYATLFCEMLTKRLLKGMKATLPTEAQWEYACRAGTTTPYSFGSVLNGDKANCNGNRPYGTSIKGRFLERTTIVKSYGANPWGLYDMHGNVLEWCSDYYGDYPTETLTDPKGPDKSFFHVFRGGSWFNEPRYCRSANRNWDFSGRRRNRLGFRFLLVCD